MTGQVFTITRHRQIDAGRRDSRRRDQPVADAALDRELALLSKLPQRQAQPVMLRTR